MATLKRPPKKAYEWTGPREKSQPSLEQSLCSSSVKSCWMNTENVAPGEKVRWFSQGTQDGGVEITSLKNDTNAERTIMRSQWGPLCAGSQSGVHRLVVQCHPEKCQMHRRTGPTEDILSRGIRRRAQQWVCLIQLSGLVQVQGGGHGAMDHRLRSYRFGSGFSDGTIYCLLSVSVLSRPHWSQIINLLHGA